ncbi:DUF7868 domain-containing protein [Janthinobacterium aquaticum]|uniref:DUF7868 domain-containing protein n=1 Tax=Janthinobacterium sp. FT58W TaxID=2654254 RepID=UPI0012642E22|nr:hypothetical protein [Janthinobacterium sp. FT58W]KAB8044385.1 hypothetical protein GCM43_04050 [Janthinobacterium sp. FT58W]
MNLKSDTPEPTSTMTLVAYCNDTTTVGASGVELRLHIADAEMARRMLSSAVAGTVRLYIALEGIRGTFDAAVLRVLLLSSAYAHGKAGNEEFLGSVALFGLRMASLAGAGGQRAGMTSYLDIATKAERFEQEALLDNAHFQIAIRPHNKLPEGIEISIGRVRIYAEPVPHR